MDLGDWLLIETLGVPQSWSVLAVGTSPRQWKSLVRMVPGRVLPIIAAACAAKEPIERELPKSRYAWSQQRARAIPIVGPGDCVHGVHFRVSSGADDDDTAPTPAAPCLFTNDNRRVEVLTEGLGPNFDHARSVFTRAETFEYVERFDGALDWALTVAQAVPDSRWLGELTVRTHSGLRTLLGAARNSHDEPLRWRGLLADVTDSVPPQAKSFEAATVDTLCSANPDLYLAVVDTERIRVLRWISSPIPGLRWSGSTEEGALPHPEDVERILAARNDILAGKPGYTLHRLRLATTDGGWLLADAEITPLPDGPAGDEPPRFALVRLELHTP